MDIVLLILLILLNGVLAMSEIAVVSSRRSRLQKLADDDSPGAKTALELNEEPSAFLSTIQVGITTVGILSGAIGENALAEPLRQWLAEIPLVRPHAHGLALSVVVVGLTYFSVVVGELVPKRLGLLAPETVAAIVAKPMIFPDLSTILRAKTVVQTFVTLLTTCSTITSGVGLPEVNSRK